MELPQGLTEIFILFYRKVRKIFFVPLGSEQKMAIVVGILVEHDHGMASVGQN